MKDKCAHAQRLTTRSRGQWNGGTAAFSFTTVVAPLPLNANVRAQGRITGTSVWGQVLFSRML